MVFRIAKFFTVWIAFAIVYGCNADDGFCALEDTEEMDSVILLQTQSQLMMDTRTIKSSKPAVAADAEPTDFFAPHNRFAATETAGEHVEHVTTINGWTSQNGALSNLFDSCADLHNKGIYFSVAVTVGTSLPGKEQQRFELVADTGSSAVIVTSCECVDTGLCNPDDKCFTGAQRSKTFRVPLAKDNYGKREPTHVAMTFGSGTVNALVASDVVQVGGVHVDMLNGLLLMVDRSHFDISGPFEGILGLGIKETSNGNHEGPVANHEGPLQLKESDELASSGVPAVPKTKVFLKEAGVERFSLCFNDNGEAGALRLNIPSLPDALPAIGSFHWGLGLYGFSVGDESEPSLLCHQNTMQQGQKTPCGMVPDSGTTLLMGPKEHIESLFENLCDKWERCRMARSSGYFHNMTKSHTFITLLYSCSEWMTGDAGISEVPSIFLTVGGPGAKKVIELTARSYITESIEQEYYQTVKHLEGVTPVTMNVPIGKPHKVCVPSFGVQEYTTIDNGPVWIMGMPLFFQYIVGYDLAGPSISFSQGKCSSCNENQVNLISSRTEQPVSESRMLRRVSGIPRAPKIDTSLPL